MDIKNRNNVNVGRMIVLCLNWFNITEIEKYIKTCLSLLWNPHDTSCIITSTMRYALLFANQEQIGHKYNNHEFLMNLTYLNKWIQIMINNHWKIIEKNIDKRHIRWFMFLNTLFFYIVNIIGNSIQFLENDSLSKTFIVRINELYRLCCEPKNESEIRYRTLLKQLLKHLSKIFVLVNNQANMASLYNESPYVKFWEKTIPKIIIKLSE